jgi:hypothetical protein
MTLVATGSALFVGLLPANVHAARAHDPLVHDPLWFRIPEQLGYFAVALAAARSRTRGRTVKPLGLSVKDSTILSSYEGSTSKS